MTRPVVALVGTLDTKGEEYGFLTDRIAAEGGDPVLIDVGVLGETELTPDVTSGEVAAAAGQELGELVDQGDRAAALSVMGRGAGIVLADLVARGSCQAVIAAGGSGGTSVALEAFSGLPFGFPKMIVSTQVAAAGGTLAGSSDVILMSSVADIAGLNRVTRSVLSSAAAAIVGAAGSVQPDSRSVDLVFASMLGLTTVGVTAAVELVEKAGYEVVTFHATGAGGMAMEGMVEPLEAVAMLDLTTVEIADEVVGGTKSAGPRRLLAGGLAGFPRVVSLGGTDMVRFGAFDSVPEAFRTRVLHRHNDLVTLMRTSPAECLEIGTVIGRRLSQSSGPVKVYVPRRGTSALSVAGGPFHDAAADDAILDGVKEACRGSRVEIIERDEHINDPVFSRVAAEGLLAMMKERARERA